MKHETKTDKIDEVLQPSDILPFSIIVAGLLASGDFTHRKASHEECGLEMEDLGSDREEMAYLCPFYRARYVPRAVLAAEKIYEVIKDATSPRERPLIPAFTKFETSKA